MQAIILAAGMGKRLGELTKENTKTMVKVNGTTLIDRLLTQLSALDLKRILIVIGYEGEKLKQYISEKYQHLPIDYIPNPIYDKTNNIYSLWLAREKLEEDDTLLIESDLIFEDDIFRMLMTSEHQNAAVVAKYESWMDGTMVQLDEENNIINFVPKKAFKYEEAEHYYKTVNIYKFDKEFIQKKYLPFLKAYIESMGNHEYYEQVLRVITLLDNYNLKAIPLTGQKWYEIDDIQDLEIAETLFASSDSKLSLYQKRYGGYWRFPELLDFCYLVNPFFPPRQMKDEMKANFDTLLSEYPSGLRINNLLAGKYFNINPEYICVGNGAAELIKVLMEYLQGNLGIILPTFEEYSNRRNENNIISFLSQNADFSYSVSDIRNFFDKKDISSLLLINPDNPSGNFLPFEDVLSLIDWAKTKNIILIIDESFVDFSENSEKNSLLLNAILETNPHLIVVKSISKSYGVPGLRLGVAATINQEIMQALKKNISIWNINSFAEFYLQIFNKYEKDYRKANEKFREERKRFFNELQRVDFLRVIPSQANYFLCEIISHYSANELTDILLEKCNILIKDCSTKVGFEKKNYIRIAIRDKEDNDTLINALKQLN